METVLWLVIIFSQISGSVIVFGWWKKCPKWLRICIGIWQCFMILSLIGLSMDK